MLSEKMKPYEFMVYPTLQTAWIKGKGILLFAGLFLVEFGAGLFLAASILNSLWGQTAGWLISGGLGGGCHFLFLGHPSRVYKAIRRPRTSWISRGLLIISLFQLLGLLHLFLSYFFSPVTWVMWAANILAVATILYGGYEIADVKPIRTWHSSFLPIQMLARSLFIGLAAVLTVNLLLGIEIPGIHLNQWLLVVLPVNTLLFGLSLASLAFEEGKEKLALSMMVKGELKRMFWIWAVIGGMVVPMIVFFYALSAGASQTRVSIFLIAVVLQMIGDPLLRYILLRTGYYSGIFPIKPNDYR